MKPAVWGPPRSTRLEQEDDVRLRAEAQRRGETMSSLLRKAVIAYLKETPPLPTEAGRAGTFGTGP